MGIVYVAHFKRSAVTRQTARTECGKSALVGKLGKRIVLIHELRKRVGAEKFTDSRYNGADIDKRLRRERIRIVDVHALFDIFVHACKADADMVLQQLADRTQTTVAEMVDIVADVNAVRKTYKIIY